MTFEKQISNLNEFFFFREFTYTKNRFKRDDGQEVEVADNIICLEDIFIIFQMKERNLSDSDTKSAEDNWFEKKVQRKATKQIRDTIKYLNDYDEIILNNERDDFFNIATNSVGSIQKIVLYSASDLLSIEKQNIKFYESQTAGIIHLISFESYKKITGTLITPAEVFEYLEFREKIIAKHINFVNSVPEEALLGQYIVDELESTPNENFSDVLRRLKTDIDAWDMTGILHYFPERITHSKREGDYYYIIREVAKLMRNELRVFKERFKLSMEASKSDKFTIPYRFAIPRLNLGFVFIPLQNEDKPNRRKGLINLTHGHKYDQKLEKCIGLSFIYENEGWFTVEWCYIESPWESNSEIEKMLDNNFPFREAKEKLIYRYNLD